MGGGEASRVLVAGIGNVFFGDDGFGSEVVRRLDQARLAPGVDVSDYGIRGVHLAYELLEGRYRALIMIDAVPMDEPPGTLAVIEVEDAQKFGQQFDAHSMNPAAVLATLAGLGGGVPRVLVVGCQPGSIDTGMALTPEVTAALHEAADLVIEVANLEAARVDASGVGAA